MDRGIAVGHSHEAGAGQGQVCGGGGGLDGISPDDACHDSRGGLGRRGTDDRADDCAVDDRRDWRSEARDRSATRASMSCGVGIVRVGRDAGRHGGGCVLDQAR